MLDTTDFKTILKTKGVAAMISITSLARLAYGLMTVSLIAAAVSYGQGYALAGAIGATATICMALVSIPKGRVIDGPGPKPLLLFEGLVTTAAALLVGAIFLYDLGPGWLLLAAVLIGVGDPSSVVISKNIWWKILPTERLRLSAMALDQTLSGTLYTASAATAGILVVYVGSYQALLAGVFFSAFSAFLLRFAFLIRDWQPHSSGAKYEWKLKKFVAPVLVYGAYFAISGALPVLLIAFFTDGLLPLALAAIYPGTMISGLLYGMRRGRNPYRVMKLNLGLSAAVLMLAAGWSAPLVICGSLFVYGFMRGAIPPSITYISFQLAGDGSGGQATGSLLVGLFAGLSAGAFLAGVSIDHFGVTTALLLLPVLMVFAFLVSLTIREPQAAGEGI